MYRFWTKWSTLRPCAARPTAASGQRDRSGHQHVAGQTVDRDRRRRLESLVAAELPGLELLAHRKLDLALRGDAQLLQKPAHRQVEGFLVHARLLCVLGAGVALPARVRATPGSAVHALVAAC